MHKRTALVSTWLMLTLNLLPFAAHAHYGPHPEGMSHSMAHAWPSLLVLVVGLCFIVWRIINRKQ